jgi:hypothetical protein
MKKVLIASLVALIVGCTTAYETKDRQGNVVSMSEEMFSVKQQQDYTTNLLEGRCEKPENSDKDDVSDVVGVANAFANYKCEETTADIAAANKPDSLLKYKFEKSKQNRNFLFGIFDRALNAGCMFGLFGACGGSRGGGNTYGDDWVFNQNNGPTQGTPPTTEAPVGPVGGNTGDQTNSIIFDGSGNAINSPMEGSVLGSGRREQNTTTQDIDADFTSGNGTGFQSGDF